MKIIINNILSILGKNVIIPVIVSYITTKITNRIQRSKELPKLLIFSPFTHGVIREENDWNENCTLLHGYFKSQRDFDVELMEFLKENDIHEDLGCQNIMEKIYLTYKNKTYIKESNCHPTKEINKIVLQFKNIPQFMSIVNRYEKFYNSSKWTLILENAGESPAYNMKIDLFTENYGGSKIYNGTLNVQEKQKIIIYYFDLVLDSKDFMYHGNKITKFFLVDKKSYKHKNRTERLFKITYNDKFGKLHEMYCCAKKSINKNQTMFGVKE